MPRLKNGLYRNPNGKTWHFHFKWRGRVEKGDTKLESLTMAREWLKAYKDNLAKGEVGIRSNSKLTLRELLALWKVAVAGAVTVKHVRDQEDRIRLHLGDWIDLPAMNLSTADLDHARSVYLAGEGRRSIGGWNQVLRRLRGLYRWAIERGHLEAIPWKPNPGKAQEKVNPIVWPEQVRAFLAAVDRGQSQDAKTAIRMMLILGLREDEALGARWEWLDARTSTYRPADTKNRKKREIPVPGFLMEYLEIHHSRMASGQILAPHVQGYTRKSVDRSGVEIGIEGLSPHRLRATFASGHFESGTPLSQIQQMLGHEDPRTTMGYIVQRPKAQAEAQDRLSALYGLAPRSEIQSGSHTVPNQNQSTTQNQQNQHIP